MPVKSKAASARKRAWRKRYDSARRKTRSGKKRPDAQPYVVALDGEGVGGDPHRYCMLSWSDNRGNAATLEAAAGEALTTRQCLSWLDRTLPRTATVVGFALGYDWTCMLTDLDPQALYRLEHVADRKFRRNRKKIVEWEGWQLDKRGTRMAFRHGKVGRFRVVWDVFRFFAKSFVWAIGPEGWNVATPAELSEVADMKGKRGAFTDKDRAAMKHYNLLECRLLARLFEKVIASHVQAGLKLKTYYGPGSTATEMFQLMVGGKTYFKPLQEAAREYPPELTEAIASAFFGGRFEHRVIGEVRDCHEYDINSAYPDVIRRLPCMQHGKWVRRDYVTERKTAAVALVSYALNETGRETTWGPFPFREKDGSICFPLTSGGGWVTWDEYRAARDYWPIRVFGAWVFEQDCDCPPPFARVADWYQERLNVGKKTGPGIALKLGYNSGYGKLAQSVGRAPFSFWPYAVMITGAVRAAILRAMLALPSTRDVLAVATDGILCRKRLDVPISERLGEWSYTHVPEAFLVRPGITFGAGSLTKARGMGLTAALSLEDAVRRDWNRHHDLEGGVSGAPTKRFCGLKLGVRKTRLEAYVRSPKFGQWYDRPLSLTFDPLPKRDGFERRGDFKNLAARRLPLDMRSMPYSRALESPDAKLLRMLGDEASDQPDGGEE